MDETIHKFLLANLWRPKDYNGGIRACCPFHNDHNPSFFVYNSRKYNQWFYKCHACEVSGSLRKLLQKLSGPFERAAHVNIQSMQRKQQRPEQEEHYIHDITQGAYDIYDYFVSRGISRDVARFFKFKMQFGPEPLALMPVVCDGAYRGCVTRYLDPAIKHRYELQSGANFDECLFAWDAIDKDKPVIVVEGLIDACVWWSHGVQAVALIIGKQWRRCSHRLESLAHPIYCPDNNDSLSFSAMCEALSVTGGSMVYIPPKFKDVSEYVMSTNESPADLLQKKNPQKGA